MSHTDTLHYATLLDLTVDPHNVRIDAGPRDDLTWYDSYDADSGQPAIAWVEWTTPDGIATDDAFDHNHLCAHLNMLDASGEYDPDAGIRVILSPQWLWLNSTQLAA